MSDVITTNLGSLSAVGQGYPVKSKSSGAHTLVAAIGGVGALVFAGALMGSNDNAAWVVVAQVAASGNGVATANVQVSGDYAFWRLDATTLTGTGAVVSGTLSTDSSSSFVGEPVPMLRDSDGSVIILGDGARAVTGLVAPLIRPAVTARPVLLSFGDSINRQDYPDIATPTNLVASVNGISPMGWSNRLCNGAFDYLGPFAASVNGQPLVNGVWGHAGQGLANLLAALPGILSEVAPRIGARPAYVLLQGNLNPAANGESASVSFDYLQQIAELLNTYGITGFAKCNEVAVTHDSQSKLTQVARYRELVMTRAASIGMLPVDIGAAFAKYVPGYPMSRLTRSSDLTHPNDLAACVYGLAHRDAVKGRVLFVPPWERTDFTGSILHTPSRLAGTGGTFNASATPTASLTGQVPTGCDLRSSGSNTTASSAQTARKAPSGALIIGSGSASAAAGEIGLFSSANPTLATGTTYQAWFDHDAIEAKSVRDTSVRVRTGTSTYAGLFESFSADMTQQSSEYHNVASLCAFLGERLVTCSHRFQLAAVESGAGQLTRGGGHAGFEPGVFDAKSQSYIRFMSIISDI